MFKRIKWPPVIAIITAITAIILGIFNTDPAITIPTALLGVTLALVARED